MKTNVATEEIINLLRKRAGQIEFMQRLVPIYESLILLYNEIKVKPLEIRVSQSEIKTNLEKGVSLLHCEGLEIPLEPMIPVWKKIHKLTCGYFTNLTNKFMELGNLPDTNYGLWKSIMESYFAKNEVLWESSEEKDALTFLLIHTWRPFLCHWAKDFSHLLKDIVWLNPFCPICSGRPDFSYLEKPSGALHLLCSRCDTDWVYHRGICVFCGNQDSNTFIYYPDDKGIYRLYACKKCLHYLKTIDCRELNEEPVLFVERIATTPMDISAIKEGYQGS